jgi:hypothetical protein
MIVNQHRAPQTEQTAVTLFPAVIHSAENEPNTVMIVMQSRRQTVGSTSHAFIVFFVDTKQVKRTL